MNKLRIFLISVLTIALLAVTSCNKDDDNNSLVGTWEYAESIEGFSLSVTITFKSDMTGTSKMVFVIAGETESETASFTYSTNGSKLTMTSGGETITVDYSLSGNKLTITDDGETIVYTRK